MCDCKIPRAFLSHLFTIWFSFLRICDRSGYCEVGRPGRDRRMGRRSALCLSGHRADYVGRMMKVIVVVAEEKFNNTEFLTVVNNLKNNDIPFEVASTSKSRASGYGSFSIVPDLPIQDVIVSDCDCLIIIGGSGCKRYLWNNPVLHEKIRMAQKITNFWRQFV